VGWPLAASPCQQSWALVEAATHACTHPAYRDRYQRTKSRLGKQRGAKVAQVDLAGRLAEAIWHVGIDLHRKRSQIAGLDGDGVELFSRRIVNDPQIFLELLQELGDDAQIALEATYGWEWLADLLEEAGYELHLSHPLRTKAIA
jgi:Transposase